MINIKKFVGLILITTLFASCEKKVGPLSDIRPAIPVTVTNATAYRPDPTVTTSLSGGGNIQIILSIPANSGRTIKEITKIAASTTYSAIQGLGSSIYYTAAPIAASGTSVTFNTSITEYFAKHPMVPVSNPAAAANAELGRRFYFLITLDDNSVIVTTPVRILVLS